MSARLVWLPALAAVLLASAPAPAQDQSTRDAQALAAQIDRHIARGWAEARAEPAPPADDAEFLRRVSLDLAGRIPSAAEARAFLDDPRPDKRARLVEQLLGSRRYVTHFTNVWRALLIPEASNNFLVRLQQGGFEAWLRQRVARNAGYDELVRDLLTASLAGQVYGPPLGGDEPSPLAFYSAKEFKPENLAATTARVFLGVSVECAQCHNHPFADWKREQFWGYAAFFSGIQSRRLQDILIPDREVPDRHELTLPGTEKVIQAKFLDGTEPSWEPRKPTRATLAEWLTSADNPYFARAAVNRVWAYFFGTGLVEPVDAMVGPTSSSNHPELLDELAREFAGHHFDLKYLIRAITASRAYQLSSARTDPGQDDRTLFARMPLRGLTPEQLFDSVTQATGYRDAAGDDPFAGLLGGNRSARAEFLAKFANQTERPTEGQTSILQALTLMNGKVIADATSLRRSETLAAVADAPFATTADRVEALYLATLTRKPDARELDRAVRFVEAGGAKGGDGDALADLFWALLNSSEFVLNH